MKTMFKIAAMVASLGLPMLASAADASPRFLVLDPSPARA
jgi:hypothetical protein